MAASPVTVVAVSSSTCCDDTSISSSNSNNNNNNSNFNNNNNNNSNNNNNNNSHNVGSSGSSSGSYGRAQARCNEPDTSTIQTKAASTVPVAPTASAAAAACVAPEAKTWPSSQGKQTTENNNDLGLGSASAGTKDLSSYGEASLAEIEADPTTDVGGQSQKPPTEVSGTGVGGSPATIAGSAVCNNDVKDEESDDEQQEIFVDALLNPTNPVPLPSTRVVRPMLTCDIIERV
ncbi:unnamed protein product [Acanthosepion pharaonis]|uniref:Uncharacterized protein n=1 Tax=Acanthosepion pharaonis TaxID=158019 RepID=A0A812ARX0_ACAPH|nr:unnamed protein product [Sepia pharaonis]